MTFLPIVDRELRVRARQRATHRNRLAAATLAILVVSVLLISSAGAARNASLGGSIFATLTGLAFLYCVSAGARHTADSLSREKREGTLGLLFLTDLRPYDVVIGKFAAHSLDTVYGLLAIFPPLAVPIVLGGVTGGEFWRHVLGLINTLFVSLAIGLAVSAATRDERRTWSTTLFLTLVLVGGPPFLLIASGTPWAEFAVLSPFAGYLAAFETNYAADPDRYWNSILAGQGIGWSALLAATLSLPRLWQDRPRSDRGTPAPAPLAAPSSSTGPFAGQPAGGTAPPNDGLRFLRRARMLDRNPAYWLAKRREGAPATLWLFTSLAAAVAAIAWLPSAGAALVVWPLLAAMVAVHLALSVWVAAEACHSLSAARDSGALELLLCTPLTSHQILNGHLLALQSTFFRPVALLVTVEVLILAGQTYLDVVSSPPGPGHVLGPVLVLLMIANALVEMKAVAAYGLWQGLICRRPAQAVARTVIRAIVLPLLFFACGPFYVLFAFVKNGLFLNYGRDQLTRRFRSIVTEMAGGTGADDAAAQEQDEARRRIGKMPPVLTPTQPPRAG